MQLEATLKPIRYRLKSGEEIILRPGVPIEVPDQAAAELLIKAANKVRQVNEPTDLVVEPTESRTQVYWQSLEGIQGPGAVTCMARTMDAGVSTFWLCVEYGGSWRWINSDLLRSREAFERQPKRRSAHAYTKQPATA